QLGFLARIDRLLRRWLPGYNYLRGRRRSSSDISSARFRSRAAGSAGSAQDVLELGQWRGAGSRKRQEVYLDTGIAKSEFCVKLEVLLRNKLRKQQQQILQQERERERERELGNSLQR
ncbi:hypothetical protein KR009_010803, partial [Drosophila setifemur]